MSKYLGSHTNDHQEANISQTHTYLAPSHRLRRRYALVRSTDRISQRSSYGDGDTSLINCASSMMMMISLVSNPYWRVWGEKRIVSFCNVRFGKEQVSTHASEVHWHFCSSSHPTNSLGSTPAALSPMSHPASPMGIEK